MTQQVTLTFEGVTATITANSDGMFDLNDVWRSFDLKASQAPSQWRNKVREALTRTADLQVGYTTQSGRGKVNHTWATKKALYNYAAWVDYEFHDAVFTAFEKLTEGKVDEAQLIADQCVNVRNKLREHHTVFTDTIQEAVIRRTVKGTMNNAASNFFKLICTKTLGMPPSKFKEIHGMYPRDALVAMKNIDGLDEYSRILAKVEAYIELGLSYQEIKSRLEVI